MIENISAIIVTYNTEVSVTQDLIDKLLKQVSEVIIFDNYSDNRDWLLVYNEHENVKVIFGEKNVGLAKAQNICIVNTKKTSNFVLIFDQDSKVENDFVKIQHETYLNLISEGKSIAAVGPTFFDRDTGYIYPATVYKGPFIKKIKVENKPVEATFIIASGSLVPLDIFRKVGLMLDDFFIDFVDVEWCMRAKSLGFSSYINPLVKMEHSIGDLRLNIFGRVISLHSDFRKFYIYRNGVFMMRLNYIPFWYKVRVFFFNLIRTTIGVLISSKKINSLKASGKGWIKGFTRFNNKPEVLEAENGKG